MIERVTPAVDAINVLHVFVVFTLLFQHVNDLSIHYSYTTQHPNP